MINVRTASSQDACTLAELNQSVHRIHVQAMPEIFKPITVEKAEGLFVDWLKMENIHFLIVETENKPVGYAMLVVRERPENLFCYARKSIYVEQIAVPEQYQGHGFGKALIDAAKKLATDLNISKIELDVWAFNEKAQAFFNAQGFEKAREVLIAKI